MRDPNYIAEEDISIAKKVNHSPTAEAETTYDDSRKIFVADASQVYYSWENINFSVPLRK